MAIKAAEREGKRHPLSLRVTASVRKGLEAEASTSGRSLTQEAEMRLEQSFQQDSTLDAMLGVKLLSNLLRALHQAFRKVQRVAERLSLDEPENDTPLKRELNTRRELVAAAEVVLSAYMATEGMRPADPGKSSESLRPWGSGDRGRSFAYAWLEWEGDKYLEAAEGTFISDDWTGDGQTKLGDLIEAGLMTEADALERRFPHGAPTPPSDIMARKDDGAWQNPAEGDEPPAVSALKHSRKKS